MKPTHEKKTISINLTKRLFSVILLTIFTGNSLFFQLFGTHARAAENYYPNYSGTFISSRTSYGDPNNYHAPYTYSDQYLFAGPPEQENAGLAHASIALVLSAFPRYDDNHEIDYSASSQTAAVRQVLTEIGYGDIENNDDYNAVPTPTSFGILGAHKVVDGCHLIALVPRSVNYTAEWVNNLYVGPSGEHAGYAQARDTRVVPFATQYLKNRGLINENLQELATTDQCVKIWMMGLSRGAAVMNASAKTITDQVGADKVYYYGFGTPVVTDDLEGAGAYTNLHNYIGPYDLFADIFSAWGMTRYGVQHTMDLSEQSQPVNAYLDDINVPLHYDPSTYQGKTMPTLDWFLTHTDELVQIWEEDTSTIDKLNQVTSDVATTSAILTPEDFTRQTFAVLFAGDMPTLGNNREAYATSTQAYDEYYVSIQQGAMDLLHILQTPALSKSIKQSYERYAATVKECTYEDGNVDSTCMAATDFGACQGSMADALILDCTNSIVLTPEVRDAGIDNVNNLYRLLTQLLVTMSTQQGREMVATIVTDIFSSQQTIIYHLPEVNLAIMAVNNVADSSPSFDPHSMDVIVTPEATASFRLLADFTDLAGVWLDGERLPADGYAVHEGSIVISLTPATVARLSEGEHTLGIGLLSNHQIYQIPFTYVRPPEPEPVPTPTHDDARPGLTPAPNNARASEAAEKTCAAPTPIGEADLFQIDRQGDHATLYFTPVTDYTDRYHVVFGYTAGDERFGGIAMPVSGDMNRGVLAVDISHLDPRRDYSFHVAPVNDCAVGTWSNWLTAKATGHANAWYKTYRYTDRVSR